jgi:hypothetical protein
MYKKIDEYFSWFNKPAVVVEKHDVEFIGFYWTWLKWKEASYFQLESFYGADNDLDRLKLSKEEFIKRFGSFRLRLLNSKLDI